MRNLLIPLLAGTTAIVAGCAMEPAPVRPATAAEAAAVCGTYGYVDINNDGFITGDEWNTYRTGAYGFWDTDKDGRISRSEFERCWRAGGFYRQAYYNPDYWTYYWSAFDANGDGFLSSDEYWSAAAWARIDANHNGRIDADEFVWWPG
jgi:EF hand